MSPTPIPSSGSIDILGVGHASFTAVNRRFYSELVKRGWNVELVIPREVPDVPGRPADDVREGDPPIHWTTLSGSSNNRYWRFRDLPAILAARRPKVVYYEGDPVSVTAIQLSRWAKKHGAALLCYINENDLDPIGTCLRKGNFKGVIRALRGHLFAAFSSPGISHVLAICQDGVEAMEMIGFRGRVSCMPLGFDPSVFYVSSAFREEKRRELGLTQTTISYMGRVAPNKGVHLLLDALETLGDLEWQFLIDDFVKPGQSPYAAEIDHRINTHPLLSARTRRFEADHFGIAAYMNASDIVVAHSVWKEQYGRVVPESMACGNVPVVSDAGALPELVGSAGVITPTGDATGIAAALRKLLLDPGERSRLRLAAIQRAEMSLSLPVQLDIVEKTIRAATR